MGQYENMDAEIAAGVARDHLLDNVAVRLGRMSTTFLARIDAKAVARTFEIEEPEAQKLLDTIQADRRRT